MFQVPDVPIACQVQQAARLGLGGYHLLMTGAKHPAKPPSSINSAPGLAYIARR
jgi:hypothetical protein